MHCVWFGGGAVRVPGIHNNIAASYSIAKNIPKICRTRRLFPLCASSQNVTIIW